MYQRKAIGGSIVRRTISLCCFFLLLSAAHAAGKQDVVLTVEGVPITKQDLANIKAWGRAPKKSFDIKSDHLAELGVLRSLITQIVAEKLSTKKELQDPALKFQIENTRKGVILESFLQKRVGAIPPPDETEVKKYLAEHPEEFKGRMMYHFGEIIIDPKTPALAALLKDRIAVLSERNALTPEDVTGFVYWLVQAHIEYGLATAWKPTEQLSAEIKPILLSLYDAKNKLNVEKNDAGMYRLLFLFDAYPDAIDPLNAKMLVANKLQDRERTQRTFRLINDLLARGNVVLYDQNYKDLDIPKQIAAAPAAEQNKAYAEKAGVLWNAATLLLFPLALAFFARQSLSDEKLRELKPYEAITFSPWFRGVAVVLLGAVMAFLAWRFLSDAWLILERRDFLAAAFVGLVVAGAIIGLCLKVPLLRRWALSNRWTPIGLILIGSILQIALVEV